MKTQTQNETITLLCSCQCPYWGNPDEENMYNCKCNDCGNVMLVCGHCLEAERITDPCECSDNTLQNN